MIEKKNHSPMCLCDDDDCPRHKTCNRFIKGIRMIEIMFIISPRDLFDDEAYCIKYEKKGS